ncbi:MAG: hypothetical protein EOR97_28175 [Mesorhizobium sp.]|uniref:hypothetical protein n=1 Tax=Mesorhizobium sp. TaxID=1871066 RepID=UPI000FE5899F|nr:hypothetical protein [Mesorhizobium sp.]RWN26523.1 MAG: hypothetical protein EOR97_28175 [Mesorhizobium sp.]
MSGIELISMMGTALSAVGTVAGGVAAKNDADFQAQQYEMKAKEEVAASQREAIAKKREGDLVNSRSQALAAASGAGAGMDAPTIVKLMAGTAAQAQYNADSAMYGGYSRAAGLKDTANSTRAAGKASLLGSVGSAFGTVLGGIDGSRLLYRLKSPAKAKTSAVFPAAPGNPNDPWAGLRKKTTFDPSGGLY